MELLIALEGVVTFISKDGYRPSGRKFHSLTGTTVLLFGGKEQGGQALNDSWIFESDTKTWKRSAVVSDFPVPALFRHAALAIHDPHSNCSCYLILSGQSRPYGKFDVYGTG